MAALSFFYAVPYLKMTLTTYFFQNKLISGFLSTDRKENEHFRLVSMKMSVSKSKTGSLHTGIDFAITQVFPCYQLTNV